MMVDKKRAIYVWLLFLNEGVGNMIASVIVDIHAKQVNRSFDYLVPTHLEQVIKVGFRVKVLFGNRVVLGFVVELKNKSSYAKKLKEIVDIVDVYPVLNEEFIQLAKFMTEHYFSYYATVLQTMIPTALKIRYQKVIRAEIVPEQLKHLFQNKKEVIIDSLSKEDLTLVYEAVKNKEVMLDTKFKKVRNEQKIQYVYVLDETKEPKSVQGKKLLAYLLELGEPTPIPVLVEDSGFTKNVIRTLLDHGILGSFEKENIEIEESVVVTDESKEMIPQQQVCFERVDFTSDKTYLLYGVTGSGKTLVYMNWIEKALKMGKQALLLVPEISLTPQMKALFKSRFGNDVAILHSRLTIKEKYEAWKRIMNHEVKIVIGARSAIFAPIAQLGIIIIDEEHENTYLQENNPRYNALELAAIRSKTHHCPLVLGSATPRISDYYKAIQGEYELLTLPERINQRPLPKKTIVDMTLELKRGNKSVFSNALKTKLLETYHRKEQAILFLNRRGHSSFVMCRSCGSVILCPHCDVSLTYHAGVNLLKCHHCGYSQANVATCPNCGSSKIRFVGSGTEKVMTEIQNLLPEARVLRVDMDTVSKMVDYETTFQIFKKHEADILVGTQMIAKGLDFENVTLVGVINADLALHYPSYDANSTAYNLIEQVSGRAGRGAKAGEVVIQTYQPNHFVIQSAASNDYECFFNQEIKNRQMTKMPPFSLALEIVVSSTDANKAHQEALQILYALKKVAKISQVLGPAEGLPFKLNDIYRFTIQIKVMEDAVLEQLKEIYPLYQNHKEVDVSIKTV